MGNELIVNEETKQNVSNLMEIVQLPVILERFKTLRAEIEVKTNNALSLPCTEETVKEIKKLRAELNKDKTVYSDNFKAIKNAVFAPFEKFKSAYDENVSSIYKGADDELKKRIDTVENELKQNKSIEVQAYFNEYRESLHIPEYVTYERANINVTLSASMKSLKEQAKAFLDMVSKDLELIETQEHKEEILVEYKKSLSVSSAITSVLQRHKEIEAEFERQAVLYVQRELDKTAEKKVEEAIESEPLEAPTSEDDKLYKTTFTVTATKTMLKHLKEFLEKGNYYYE